MTDHVGNRARRDLVTNQAWFEMIEAVRGVLRKETVNLHSIATSQDLAGINTQAGVVQGVERCLLRLTNFQKDILTDASPPDPA